MEPNQSKANNRNNLITLFIVGVSLILILLQVGTNFWNNYKTKQNQISQPTNVEKLTIPE
jgi:hypothetical protein